MCLPFLYEMGRNQSESDENSDQEWIPAKKSRKTLPLKGNKSGKVANQQAQSAASPNQEKLTVKPVFVNLPFEEVRNTINKLKLKGKVSYKIQSASSTQLLLEDLESKRTIIQSLKAKNIGFHTFTEKSDKHSMFILKGFYETSCENIIKLLKETKVPVVKVTKFNGSKHHPVYLAHFQGNETNIHVLNHNFRKVDNIIIKWEILKKKQNSQTQCFNCQRWGHTSLNCGFKFRCVKCTESHAQGNCKRTTRDGEPQCVNCGKNHAASHRKCQAFISYINKIKKSNEHKNHIKAKKIISEIPDINGTNFPPITQAVQFDQESQGLRNNQQSQEIHVDHQVINNAISYSEKLNEAIKNEELFKKLAETQDRLRQNQRLVQIIQKYCDFMEELFNTSTDRQAIHVIMKLNHWLCSNK